MSYIIKFKNNNFIISNTKETLILENNNYYKELKDFLVDYNYIKFIINKNMNTFILITKFGSNTYNTKDFTSLVNTNNIPLYDIAKITYIFFINKVL